jgi:hypothetical protein
VKKYLSYLLLANSKKLIVPSFILIQSCKFKFLLRDVKANNKNKILIAPESISSRAPQKKWRKTCCPSKLNNALFCVRRLRYIVSTGDAGHKNSVRMYACTPSSHMSFSFFTLSLTYFFHMRWFSLLKCMYLSECSLRDTTGKGLFFIYIFGFVLSDAIPKYVPNHRVGRFLRRD